MFCATFQFPDELLFYSDTQQLEVRGANNELAEIKYSGGNSSGKRTCAERTVCEVQIEKLEPQPKKNKSGWNVLSLVSRAIVNV